MGFHGWFAEADFNAQFQTAQKACQHLLPFGNAQGTETHQEFLNALKSAACMRSHGYPNWPDPNPNVAGVSVPTGVDTKSTQFRVRGEDLRRARAPQRVMTTRSTSEPGRSGRPHEG